jgi:hypothetical protein
MENKSPSAEYPVHQKVLDKINKSEITMHSRWYFVFLGLFSLIAALVMFVLSVFLISFVLYLFQNSDLVHLPMAGTTGYYFFLILFPWFPVIFSVILVSLIGIPFRHYTFMHVWPFIYNVIVVVALIGLVSFIIQLTPLHHRLWLYTVSRQTPLLARFYNNYNRTDNERVLTGELLSAKGNNLIIRTNNQKLINLTITSSTDSANAYAVNDRVLVIVQSVGQKTEVDYIKDENLAR